MDTSHFDDFYRLHRADAVRWAVALVGSRAVAEELAHDSLLAVGRRLDTIDNPAGYLRRTVVNNARSWHRTHLRERRRIALVNAGQPTSYTQPTRDTLDALARLPYRQRAAVTLRYWADWTDADIAAALGTSEGNVRVLVHRGLAHLRSALAAGTSEGSDR